MIHILDEGCKNEYELLRVYLDHKDRGLGRSRHPKAPPVKVPGTTTTETELKDWARQPPGLPHPKALQAPPPEAGRDHPGPAYTAHLGNPPTSPTKDKLGEAADGTRGQ